MELTELQEDIIQLTVALFMFGASFCFFWSITINKDYNRTQMDIETLQGIFHLPEDDIKYKDISRD